MKLKQHEPAASFLLEIPAKLCEAPKYGMPASTHLAMHSDVVSGLF